VITSNPRLLAASAVDGGSTGSRQVVISACDLGKAYHLFDQSQDRLKAQLFGRFGRQYGRMLWALRDVSFDVYRGEAFGIIGRNGSGKSTLLQLLVGVLQPSEGNVSTVGRIGALLELGSGFDPELTGRDNVYLAGSVLGLSTKEIDQLLPRVIDFSELGDFIEQPIKYYSSGMFVRLAFALNTSVDAEILILDEALAVGDVFFQQKCYRRLEQLREQGVTILLVSHSMAEIEQFCDRALVLDSGRATFVGDAREAVQRYYLLSQGGARGGDRVAITTAGTDPDAVKDQSAGDESLEPPHDDAWLDVGDTAQVSNGWARCLGVALSDESGRGRRVFEQGETAVFHSMFEIVAPVEVPISGIVIHNARGVIVHGRSTLEYGTAVPQNLQPGDRIRFRQSIALEIGIGEHTFELGFADVPEDAYRERAVLPHELLAAQVIRVCDLPGLGPFVVTYRANGRPVQLLHHGVANLPGRCDAVAQRTPHQVGGAREAAAAHSRIDPE
jgi:lipopolysaccharide transport system ATP-binding protein